GLAKDARLATTSYPCTTICTRSVLISVTFCFYKDTASPEIYTLSLHDALPICIPGREREMPDEIEAQGKSGQQSRCETSDQWLGDRKSTRLNSSHRTISYAVFCLKKKRRTLGNPTASTTSSRSQSCKSSM